MTEKSIVYGFGNHEIYKARYVRPGYSLLEELWVPDPDGKLLVDGRPYRLDRRTIDGKDVSTSNDLPQ